MGSPVPPILRESFCLAVSGSTAVEPRSDLGAEGAEGTVHADAGSVFIEPVDKVHIEPVGEVHIEPVEVDDVVVVDEHVVGVEVDAEVRLDDLFDFLVLVFLSSTTATSPRVLPVSECRPSLPMLSTSAANMLWTLTGGRATAIDNDEICLGPCCP